jgi:SAM-dependent methyltransferase
MYGSDCNDAHVSWCEAHLPFARVVGHGLRPPAPFADASFGFVYGLSVFTHLPEEVQLAWMTELRRVLRPGGLLLMSFHGEGFAERMTHRERRRFESGHVVVRRPELAPTNLCMTFHPRDYVTDVLADGLDVVAFEPNGLAGMRQDVVLLRKPSEPAAT